MRKYIKEFCMRFSGFIFLAIGLFICYLLGSCKSVEYVPVEHIKEVNNEHYHDRVVTDTVREQTNTIIRQMNVEDSAYFASLGVKIRGLENTLLVERNAFRDEIKSLSDKSADTLRIVEQVPLPYPVERKLSRWEQLKIDYAGYLALIALALFISLSYLITHHYGRNTKDD